MSGERVERRLARSSRPMSRDTPADGAGRGRHPRTPQGAPPRADRSEDRRAPGPHRQDHRRRAAGRVRQRRRCGALRRRGAARRWPSAMPASPPEQPHRVPHRHQSRRHHRRGRRHLRRRRQCRRPARRPGRARRDLRLGTRARQDAAASSTSPSRTSASSSSRTSPGRCGSTACGSTPRGSSRRSPRRAPTPAAARQAVDRGAAVPEHERRPGAGIFRRRHGRGDHHRALAASAGSSSSPAIRASPTRAKPST